MTKILEIITKIRDTQAATNENIAKPVQPSVNLNQTNINTIAVICIILVMTIRIKCIFPRQVVISLPASNGKKEATSNPINELAMKRIGPTRDPSLLLTPQCIPAKNVSSNMLVTIIMDWKTHLL